MTEQITEPQTTPEPSVDGAEQPKPAPKKRAAKKAAAPAPAAEPKKDVRSIYLPALPEEFAYTSIVATGPRGETITITAENDGKAHLAFSGANLDRTKDYDDLSEAVRGGAKAAKAMADVAKREAELAKVREEAFDL